VIEEHPGNRFQNGRLPRTIWTTDRHHARLKDKDPLGVFLDVPQFDSGDVQGLRGLTEEKGFRIAVVIVQSSWALAAFRWSKEYSPRVLRLETNGSRWWTDLVKPSIQVGFRLDPFPSQIKNSSSIMTTDR
jgi:hypothetical protein